MEWLLIALLVVVALAGAFLVGAAAGARRAEPAHKSTRKKITIEKEMLELPSASNPSEVTVRVLSLVTQHRKIEAIKLVRELYGLGLKEAKDLVDNVEQGRPLVLERPQIEKARDKVDDGALQELVRAGQMLEAIKLLRTQNPEMGLKEAKDYVEGLSRGR